MFLVLHFSCRAKWLTGINPILRKKYLMHVFLEEAVLGFLRKCCFKNKQQIYRRTPLPKCESHFSMSVLPVSFQNTFSQEHLWAVAFWFLRKMSLALNVFFEKNNYYYSNMLLAHAELSQTPKMFHLYLKCSAGFWIRLCSARLIGAVNLHLEEN